MRMKKFFVLAMLVIAGTLFVACGGNADTPTATPNSNINVDVGARTPATRNITQGLVGTWNWEGFEYYVFNANGTGTVDGDPLEWWTGNGVLSICVTPDMCGDFDDCLYSMDMYYTLQGNNLTLSCTAGEWTYYYTRN